MFDRHGDARREALDEDSRRVHQVIVFLVDLVVTGNKVLARDGPAVLERIAEHDRSVTIEVFIKLFVLFLLAEYLKLKVAITLDSVGLLYFTRRVHANALDLADLGNIAADAEYVKVAAEREHSAQAA